MDKPVNASDNAAGIQGRSLSDAKLIAFLRRNSSVDIADTPKKWTLDQLALAAYYFNPDLDIARAQLAAAKGASRTASSIPNPSVSAVPTYDTTTPPPWILGLSFDIPIETAGKRGYREDQAAHLTEAAVANLSDAAWKVRANVRAALLALYIAEERRPLLQRQAAAEAESVHISEQLLTLGEVSAFEVTQSRAALSQIRFTYQDNEAELVNARARLANAIGLSPGALTGVEFDFSGFQVFPPALSTQAVQRIALTDRPDIRAGLAQYDATQSALQLEIAKQYPDIHLGPGYQRDQTDDKWTLGLTFNLPIFDQNQGPIAEAEAKRTEAKARFDSLQTKIASDVEQAVTTYRTSLSKVKTAQTLTNELQGQVETAQRMLKLGELSKIELAQRQLELTTALLSQLDALSSAQSALGAVEIQLQSPKAVQAVTVTSPRDIAAFQSQQGLRLVQTIPLSNVKGGFDLMTVDVAGKRLFIDAEDNNTAEVIDLAQGHLQREIDGLHTPKWVVYRPEMNKLYIANGDGEVRVFDATTFEPLHTITLREKANNLHFDPVSHELFVGVGATFGEIAIIDTANDAVTGHIPLSNSPNQFEIDGDLIYVNVPTSNRVEVISRHTRSVEAVWPLTSSKQNRPMALDRIHHRLFIGFEPGKLAVVDTATGVTVAALDIEESPDGIHYDPTKNQIYVSCGAGAVDVIKQIDPDHYEVIDRVSTAKGAGTSLYVPEFDELILPVPQNGRHAAEVRIYAVDQK